MILPWVPGEIFVGGGGGGGKPKKGAPHREKSSRKALTW